MSDPVHIQLEQLRAENEQLRFWLKRALSWVPTTAPMRKDIVKALGDDPKKAVANG